MADPQLAICAADESFAIFLTLTVKDAVDAVTTLRRVAGGLPDLTVALAKQVAEPSLVSAIAFGAGIWPRLYGQPQPPGLEPFAPLAQGGRVAPATPADVFLHIHSQRHDANFALARAVIRDLGDAVAVVEEIHGFRTRGGRDLTGFVDGTENPEGEERAPAALVADADAVFAAGSYVSVQRYVHELGRWERLSIADQEGAIGRTKADDQEMDDAVKPPSAHIARVVIEEDGEELQIVRHSLPYGTTREHGLYFVAYGATPEPFRRMLRNMIESDSDGHHDRLLDFTRAVTGAALFAPSQDFLRDHGAAPGT
ncbi:MAG: Dyp-type peroxidase [Azospirillaceae bacterium]|nr:Dyp-type peroxidase [Azospirillaceae bacterium]